MRTRNRFSSIAKKYSRIAVFALLIPATSWPTTSWAFPQDAASFEFELSEIEEFLTPGEESESIASPSSRERRAWKKIERRFNRQFKRLSKRIHRVLDDYSAVELAEILQTSDIRTGDLVKNALSSHPSLKTIYDENGAVSPIALIDLLHSVASKEYAKALWAELEDEVRSYGGALEYLRAKRKLLAPLRSINGCLWKEGVIRTLSAPLNAVSYVNAGGAVVVGLLVVLPIEHRRKEKGKPPHSWISRTILFPFGLVAKAFTYEKLAFRGEYPEYDCAFEKGVAQGLN